MDDFKNVKRRKRGFGSTDTVTITVYSSESGPVILCKKNDSIYINFSGSIFKYKLILSIKSKQNINAEFKKVADKISISENLTNLDKLVIIELNRVHILKLYLDMCSRIFHNFEEIKMQNEEKIHTPGSDLALIKESGFQKTIFKAVPYENNLSDLLHRSPL